MFLSFGEEILYERENNVKANVIFLFITAMYSIIIIELKFN